MKKPAIALIAAAVLVVGAAAVVGTDDYLRAVAVDTVTPLPESSAGPLDPAAQRYFDAVAAQDADALAAAFAEDAVVLDVGREIAGRDAIRTWASNEVIGGVYTVLDHTARTGGVDILVRFQPGGIGGFRADYRFDLADGLITRAELAYA